jgi:superfamily II DNA or RNA helicase
MNYRDELQDKWAKEFLTYNQGEGKGILHLCPRSGKTRTTIRIFCKIQRNGNAGLSVNKTWQPKILICYPDKNIQQSWESDFKAVGYNNPNITYVTHVSLKKEVQNQYDIIVCDEIHLLSFNQKSSFANLMRSNPSSYILGLSGTLSSNTEFELKRDLGLEVISKYSLEEAIKDGIISDYRINIILTDLDNNIIVDPKKQRTEKEQYNAISWVIKNKGQSLFLNLLRMRIIHNSIAKIKATKDLLDKLQDKRVLVFCANNKVANQLGCKIHTSKYYDQEEFEKFISNSSSYNHYAVCKIGNTGVSFRSLDHIIVQAFDSNSENLTQRICRSLILDAPGKVSNIYIVSSTEEVELKWLKKSLEFFDKKKIQYL